MNPLGFPGFSTKIHFCTHTLPTSWQEFILARRNRGRHDRLEQLLRQVRDRFDNSPLQAVGRILADTITDVQRSVRVEATSPEEAEKIAIYISRVLDCLPVSFRDRFTFDAQLIGTLAQECSQGTVSLSRMLVPKSSRSWGHQSVAMPSTDGERTHVIDVIHLPGEDDLDDIDLLDYAFVCHELGHNILFRHGDQFTTAFKSELDAVMADLQRKSLGVRGMAKQVADGTADKLRQYWNPTPDHHNWAHEIAVDVISLWLCGPAYLAALQYVMEAYGVDPHQLEQSHPSYEIRARSLIVAAGQLGWAYYTGRIEELVGQWSASATAEGEANLHVACADPRLMNGAVSASIQICRALSLPRCTPSRIDAVRAVLRQGKPPAFGTELILAAWLKHTETTETEFDEWERRIIRDLLADITQ